MINDTIIYHKGYEQLNYATEPSHSTQYKKEGPQFQQTKPVKRKIKCSDNVSYNKRLELSKAHRNRMQLFNSMVLRVMTYGQLTRCLVIQLEDKISTVRHRRSPNYKYTNLNSVDGSSIVFIRTPFESLCVVCCWGSLFKIIITFHISIYHGQY